MDIVIPKKESVKIGEYSYSSQSLSNCNSFKRRPVDVTVDGCVYKVQDGMALSKCKEIATALGVAFKPSWFAAQIAKAVLDKVLGDAYENPVRGKRMTVYNCAIFDGYLMLHEYENDGFGDPDSIKKSCYIYKK